MNMNEKNKVENCRIEPKLKLINMDSVEVEQIEWRSEEHTSELQSR